MTNFLFHEEQTVKRMDENRLGFLFCFPFDFVFMSMSPCPCLHVQVSRPLCLCLHVSMTPCFHVSCLCFHVSMSPSPCLCVSMFAEFRNTENRTNGKRQLPFVCCKREMEMTDFRLFAANGNRKWKFVFLFRQTINGNRRLLFQQTCPSMGSTSKICT
jgi:hypothetical protein